MSSAHWDACGENLLLTGPLLGPDEDWKRRFRASRYLFQIAEDNPDRVLVASNETGMFELYALDIRNNTMSQVTRRPSGTIFGKVSPDGSHVYYVDDKLGNETGHVVRVPFGPLSPSPQDMTPNIPEYTLVDPFVDSDNSQMGLTIPGPDGFSTFIIDISGSHPGDPVLIRRGTKSSGGPLFSKDGKLCVIWSADRFGGLDHTLLAYEAKPGQQIAELADDFSRVEEAAFSPLPGDSRLLANSNRSGETRPLIWDPVKGTRSDLPVSQIPGDVKGLSWSPSGKMILLYQTHKAATRLWTYDLETQEAAMVRHPDGTIGAAQFRTEGSVLFSWQDSTNPPRLMEVGLSGNERPRIHLAPKDVPKSWPWRTVSFHSSDGQEIQGWVATPPGAGPFPTILDTHGGPTSVQLNVFAPRAQVWLDHGFAYLSVNYRGSTTFGKDFEKKINGDLGHWEVEDMVAGRRWLIENGISAPDMVFLTGWSYGGYLTLHAMGLYPKLWAGGMGGVVVADWVSQYEDEPDEMRGYDVALLGGTLDEKRERFVNASPLTYIENLTSPLLIIQGKRDVRDPPRQVEIYEKRAHELRKDVEVIWFETGHAGSGLDMNLVVSHHEAMLRWMYKVLDQKGRMDAQGS